jgi:hypothetical protein
LLLAAMLVPAAAAEETSRRTLHLSATGEALAAPDMAIVDIGMENTAATARKALAANTRVMQRIFTLLKEKWHIADRDMTTGHFSINPVYRQIELPNGSTRPRLEGYRVTNMLTVRVRRLEDLGPLLDAVVSAGGNRIRGIRFGFSDPEKLKEQARRDAVRKVLAKARVLAEEAGFTLGPVLTLRESEGMVSPPVPVYRKMAPMARAQAMPVPIAGGEGRITVTVSITWEIR